jgi:hypothetical protein
MYNDFVESFPECVELNQKNLQKHVRGSLEQLKTGTSNEGNGKAALQSQYVMKRLKLTNSNASKVMLARREAIINNAQQPSAQASNKQDGVPGEVKPTDFGPKTPSRRQANAKYSAQIAEDFKSSSEASWIQHLQQKMFNWSLLI